MAFRLKMDEDETLYLNSVEDLVFEEELEEDKTSLRKKIKTELDSIKIEFEQYENKYEINHEMVKCESDNENQPLKKENQKPIKRKKRLEGTLYRCEHCDYMGNCEANLQRHYLIHEDPDKIKWYPCSLCNYKTKYDYQLKSHEIVHCNPKELPNVHCQFCDFKSTRKTSLRRHIFNLHRINSEYFECAECGYRANDKSILKYHINDIHSRETFKCSDCSFITKNMRYLKVHVRNKHLNRDLLRSCSICDFRSKTQKDITRHFNRMHNKSEQKLFKCSQCSFQSIYKKNVELHRIHIHEHSKGMEKFVCGHCKMEFRYKSQMKNHIIRRHVDLSDEDYARCPLCPYKSKIASSLKRHKLKHSKETLKCGKCEFETRTALSMVAHQKTHESGDVVYLCDGCPYRATNGGSFKYHMQKFHKVVVNARNIDGFLCSDR